MLFRSEKNDSENTTMPNLWEPGNFFKSSVRLCHSSHPASLRVKAKILRVACSALSPSSSHPHSHLSSSYSLPLFTLLDKHSGFFADPLTCCRYSSPGFCPGCFSCLQCFPPNTFMPRCPTSFKSVLELHPDASTPHSSPSPDRKSTRLNSSH